MSIPKFKNSYAPKAPDVDKYADALRIIDANLSVNKDGAKINDLKASINGMREEEKAGEISSAEATRNLENLVKMYRGGTRRRRGGATMRDPNGPIRGGRSNKKKSHRRRR
jgi:hypothetical protein